eukprot:g126.t1
MSSWTNETESYYKKTFKYSLSRGDGNMDFEAFRKSLGILGLGSDNEGLAKLLFKAIAPENAEIITCKEYLHALRTMIEGTPEDKIRFGYTLLDNNKSNKVTGDDIRRVMKILYRSYSAILGYSQNPEDRRRITVEDVEDVVESFDRDHNGDIQISEWILGIMEHQDIFTNLAHVVDPEAAMERWKECKQCVSELERLVSKEFRPPKMPRLPEGVKAKCRPPISAPRTSMKGSTTMMSDADSFDAILDALTRARRALDSMRRNLDYFQPVSALPQTLYERRRAGNMRRAVAAAAAAAAATMKGDTTAAASKESSSGSWDAEESASSPQSRRSSGGDEEDAKGVVKSPKRMTDRSLLKERIAASTKGSVVAFGSEYWDTTLGIMQGIHLSAVRAAGEGNRPLSRHDFHTRDKYKLKPESVDPNFDRKKTTADIKFYDYAPRAFHYLRTVWGISTRDYISSCGPGKILSNLIVGSLTAISRMRSEGKSGDFFYTTGDSRFMMKTIAKLEFQTFRDMVPDYVKHMTVTNPEGSPPTPGLNSLICKFAGLHKMKITTGKKVQKLYFVVMLNCNPPDDVVTIHRRLDLKGSYAGRTAIKKQSNLRSLKALPLDARFDKILKDNDFDSLVHSIGNIRIGSDRKLLLTETMRADVKFLQRYEIMDYSLIISCHYKVPRYVDLDKRPSQDFNDPKWQLREAFQAPVSLKREDIENGMPKPYLCNIDLQNDICDTRTKLEMQSSYVDLSIRAAPVKKTRTHGVLSKRNDNFSLLQGRWSDRYFELHNMFLYYWKSRKAREKGKDTWTAAWNLLRVDTVTLDEEENTLTLAFDDIVKDAGCEVTRKVVKHKDLWVLREWEAAIRDRLHYFRSGELEAFYVRQMKATRQKFKRKIMTKEKKLENVSTKFDTPKTKKKDAASSGENGEKVGDVDEKQKEKDDLQLHDDHENWGITASDNSAVFYIGIVDCFTTFDTTRGISYFFEGSNKSNVPPDMYARRFFNVNKTRFC